MCDILSMEAEMRMEKETADKFGHQLGARDKRAGKKYASREAIAAALRKFGEYLNVDVERVLPHSRQGYYKGYKSL